MRKDQHRITVVVDGFNTGVWDVMTGGEADTDELTYKPGGMAPPISLGGIVTLGQLVISRIYKLERDHGRARWLMDRVGTADVVVNKIVLQPDKTTFGKPIVWRGKLKRCTLPEVDSQSTDAAIIELEVTPQGGVS
jgi:hypothetical protein